MTITDPYFDSRKGKWAITVQQRYRAETFHYPSARDASAARERVLDAYHRTKTGKLRQELGIQ